jgi:hypothetical protein
MISVKLISVALGNFSFKQQPLKTTCKLTKG